MNLISAFLQQASAQGSRSTVLKPLGWMLVICISGMLSASYLHLDPWVLYMFAMFCALAMFLYMGAYIFCLIVDRDALRSETYTIQKMALEKGYVGDSVFGVLADPQTSHSSLLGAAGNDPVDVEDQK